MDTNPPSPQGTGPFAGPTNEPGAPLAGGVLDSSRPCVRCGYDLMGLPIGGQCPECGTPVADSLKGILLEHAAAEYLATLHHGLKLVLWSILLYVGLMIVVMFATVALGVGGAMVAPGAPAGGPGAAAAPPVVPALVQPMLQLLMLVPAIMGVIGYYRFSTPDPGFLGQEKPDSARQVLRVCSIVAAVNAGLSGAVAFSGGAFSPGAFTGAFSLDLALAIAAIVVALVGGLAWIVQFFAVMRYTRWLGRRVPDDHIVRRTQMYMWLLPVLYIVGSLACGLGPLIALVLYWNLLHRLRLHVRSIIETGVPRELPGMVSLSKPA